MLGRHSTKEITALTSEVLDKLRLNRDQHAKLVQEARDGFVAAAIPVLVARLAALQQGKIVNLRFDLTPPQDHSKEYETALMMLEMHLRAGEDRITLTAADVQQFILDEWEWTDNFLLSNIPYSGSAALLAREKGLR